MTKILIKKQLMEVFSWIYQDKKTGKNRDKKGMLLYVFFYVHRSLMPGLDGCIWHLWGLSV